MAREDWLNGWPRMGLTAVLMVASVRCVGCGKDHVTARLKALRGQTQGKQETKT